MVWCLATCDLDKKKQTALPLYCLIHTIFKWFHFDGNFYLFQLRVRLIGLNYWF